MALGSSVHRAGALKQTNKLHKTGKHRSNRQIDNDNKGEFCNHRILHLLFSTWLFKVECP